MDELSPLINGLTPSQELEYRRCLDSLLRPGYERSSVEAALRRIYACAGLEEPHVFWCDSSWQICVMPFLLQMLLHRHLPGSFDAESAKQYHDELLESLREPQWRATAARLTAQLTPEIESDLIERPVSKEILDAKYVSAFNWSRIGVPIYNRLFEYISANMREAYEVARRKLSPDLDVRLSGEVRARLLPFEQAINWLSGRSWLNPGRPFADAVSPESNRSRRQYCIDIMAQQLDAQLRSTEWERIVRTFPHIMSNGRPGPINVALGRHLALVLGAGLYDVWSSYANNRAAYYKILDRTFGSEMFDAATSSVIADLDSFFCGVFAYACFGRTIFICEQPALHIDEQNRLHCTDGAAVRFPDGYSLYALGGIEVPSEVFEQPELLTVDLIDRQRNVELRRVLIDRYGIAQYLEDGGAIKIDESEFGTLYEKAMNNDEPILIVRVLNSTPEPDGSVKHYFLRVPPDMRSAKDAVAWTFGMSGEEYAPMRET